MLVKPREEMKRRSRIALVLTTALIITMGFSGCGGEYSEPLPPRDALYYPIGLKLHPDGRFLYVVNSNFDLRYRGDQGGTVTVIDTETGELMGNSSPFIPSYGAYMELNEDATKAYITSRYESEVTILDVAEQGQALFCAKDGEPSPDSRSCRVRRVPDNKEGSRIPRDPFGIALTRAQRTIGDEVVDFDLVHLSHLQSERQQTRVTALSFPNGEEAGASMRSASLLTGNQVVRRPGTQDIYVAGRTTNLVAAFRPFVNDVGQVEAIVNRGNIILSRRQETVDARGIAFDDEGQWLYVATRRPNALHLIGMSAGANGEPALVRTIPLEQNPSEVVVHQGADGVKRIYVPSYRRGVIEVVDAEQEAVVDIIDVGRSPYSMVVDRAPANCGAPGERCLGFVTLFDAGKDGGRCGDDDRSCGRVAVIDLDPASESFHTVVDYFE